MFCKFYNDVSLTIIICRSNPVTIINIIYGYIGKLQITLSNVNNGVCSERFCFILATSIMKWCGTSVTWFGTYITLFAGASWDLKTAMLLSRWPSFLSRAAIFSFCFVMVSYSKTNSRCILCIAGSLDNVQLVWVSWSSCGDDWRQAFSCYFDVDQVLLDFGVEDVVAVRYVLICR